MAFSMSDALGAADAHVSPTASASAARTPLSQTVMEGLTFMSCLPYLSTGQHLAVVESRSRREQRRRSLGLRQVIPLPGADAASRRVEEPLVVAGDDHLAGLRLQRGPE